MFLPQKIKYILLVEATTLNTKVKEALKKLAAMTFDKIGFKESKRKR